MIQKYKRFTEERVDDDVWDGTDQDWNDDWIGSSRTPLTSRFDMSGEIADDEDFYDNDYYGGNHNFNDYDNRDIDKNSLERDPDLTDDDVQDDDIEHLKYLLRGMFKNKGFHNVSITNDNLDINIRCNLSARERLSDLISLFDLVNKLKTDILPQYDSDYETWESQKGQVMEFGFYYDEGLNDDTDEDYGEDDGSPF
jgi:hypothetical protein